MLWTHSMHFGPTMKSSNCIEADMWKKRSSRATSANTRIAGAPQACSIISIRNGVTEPTNWAIARRWPVTWRRWSKCARPWERGTCHESFWGNTAGGERQGGGYAVSRPADCWMPCRSGRARIQNDVLHFEGIGNCRTVYGAAGADGPLADRTGREDETRAGTSV